jgi:hypothetical protein
LEENKFKVIDILYGVIIPLVLILLVYVLAVFVNPNGDKHVLGETGIGGTLAIVFTQGFGQMIVLGVPLVLGLLWNKWAGGAAGFIMGGIYYVASAGLYNGYYGTTTNGMGGLKYNFFGDISVLMWILYGVSIGYMAGSLANGSTNFKRMLGAGLTASLLIAFIQAYFNYTISLSPSRSMAQGLWATNLPQALLINFVPYIVLGVVVPILAKVMTWYGLQPMRH